MKTKPLPCPFCGKNPKVYEAGVGCINDKCFINPVMRVIIGKIDQWLDLSIEDAISIWNERVKL